jgi:hypothetical protein
MLRQQLRSIRECVHTQFFYLLHPVRTHLNQTIFMSCVRMLALLSMCVLLGVLTLVQNTPKAFAIQARPPADWSFYITSTSTSTAYTFGCDQGRADASFSPPINSEVVLDFGGQLGDSSGALMINGVSISNSQLEAVTEAFAQGYWDCTTTNDNTSVMHLAIGTNNSFADISFAGGQAWVNEVAAIQAFITSKGFDSQIVMLGANDLEPGFGDAPSAIDWANGFASVSGFLYLNYGSADGCPQFSADNGSCINGWNQFDVWYVSWGAVPAEPAPEIYFLTQSRQWAMISLYGAQSQSNQGAVLMQGPWDEHDLDTTTLTSAQAWNALWTDLNNNSATAQDMPFAMEIQRE